MAPLRKGLAVATALAALLAVLAPAPSGAQEVRLVRLPDGSRLLFNEPGRAALRPRPAPQRLEPLIAAHARQRHLDPRLVQAVIQVESGYRPWAVSPRGAMGLMQLMPETARALAVTDPYDPEQNIAGGTAYLRQMLDEFGGRLELALAGYNAGPAAVYRFDGIPPYRETLGYVENVLRLYRSDPDLRLAAGSGRLGRPTHLWRDAGGHLRLSTRPPAAP